VLNWRENQYTPTGLRGSKGLEHTSRAVNFHFRFNLNSFSFIFRGLFYSRSPTKIK
jgi:hypothetical protein